MAQLEYCPIVGGGPCNKSDIDVHVKRNTFFLAEPFENNEYRERRENAVRNSLNEALENYSEDSLQYADKEPRETAIFCDICRLIQSCEYGIADLSGLVPNVLIELGMMFAFGKPVFILVEKNEKESLREKLPSDIFWKRAIPFRKEFIDIDIQKKLVTQVRSRKHSALRPLPLKFVFDKKFEEYDSVKTWFNNLGKKSPLNEERKNRYESKIFEYCEFSSGMNPDEIIKDAQKDTQWGGLSKLHSELLSKFLENMRINGTKVGVIKTYRTDIGSFYHHNGIALNILNTKYKPENPKSELTTTDLQKICEMAKKEIRHQSWILADSYLGLDVGELPLLTVEDFTEEWRKKEKLYPVRIRKEVSGTTFDRTLYIGADAKAVVEAYFNEKGFLPQEYPWAWRRQTFSNKFTDLAKKAKVVPLEEKTKNKGKRVYSPKTAKALKKRLEKILNKHETDNDVVLHIQGSLEDHRTPREGQIRDAYEKAWVDLKIFNNEV